jgi:hypothetical protein
VEPKQNNFREVEISYGDLIVGDIISDDMSWRITSIRRHCAIRRHCDNYISLHGETLQLLAGKPYEAFGGGMDDKKVKILV